VSSGYTVTLARERFLRRLNEMSDGVPLDQLLPEVFPDSGDAARRALLWRSGWTTTFVARLELARQRTMGQGGDFEPTHVASA
jgi:hypothetical protein